MPRRSRVPGPLRPASVRADLHRTQPGDQGQRAVVKAGAERAAADFNIDPKYESPPTTDPQAQATLITDAAGQKPAAMVVTIPDRAVLNEPIKAATAAGTPVVVANIGADQVTAVGAVTYVGQDETLAGQRAGTAMVNAGVKRALCVIHEAQNKALTDRCDGFAKKLAEAGGTVTVVNIRGIDRAGFQTTLEDALKKDTAIDGILATGIDGFTAASGALKSLGISDKVKLGSFDVSLVNLTAVKDGDELFVVDQQPFLQGYDAVLMAAFQARFGQHPLRPIYTGPSLITRDNAGKVLELYKVNAPVLVNGGSPQ
jgi:simple sugar transport system substrate-binding protein